MVEEAELIGHAEMAQWAPEIQEHLEEILTSNAFRGSHRSQDFLRHVVDLTLKGEVDRLKERILGIEIFHRNSEYDTSEDAIVRVTANDVRRRLMLYYAEQPHEDLCIRLLSGSYIPEFRRAHSSAAAAEENAATQAAAVESAKEPAPADLPELSPSHEAAAPAPAPNNYLRAFALRRTLFWTALASLVLGAFAAGWLFGRLNSPAVEKNAAAYSFYQEMLGPLASDPHMATNIILSNPKLFLYRGSDQPNPNDAEDPHYPLTPAMAKDLAQGANDTQASFPYHRLVLDESEYTGMGEAKALFGVEKVLSALGRPAHLSESRFLNWDVAQSEHLVVLGAPHMSAWTQSTLADTNFIMDHDQIRNTHPQPGEQAVYASNGTHNDYALIWMSQSPSGARILLIAGITSTSTAGAGIFFSSPESMRPVYEQIRRQAGSGAFPANWQVLLHVTERDRIPVNIVPVAMRFDKEN